MADDGIAVEVEADVDNGGSYDEDAAMRAQAMINSPKGKNTMSFADDDDDNAGNSGGMSLNLSAVDDEYEDPEKVTPNTRQRDQMDVNSPRNKPGTKWDANSGANGNDAALAGLVTQVPRDDPSKRSGVESLVTQVSRSDDTEVNIKKQQQSVQPSGMCAMLSCLFCCCSQPQPPEAIPLQSTGNAEQRYPPSSHGGAQQKQSAQTPPSKEDNTKLLTTEGGHTDRKDAAEDSQSSTMYPDANNALLPPLKPEHVGKKCLILDLDETLVHSSFKPIPNPDFIIPVEIDKVVHHVYVLKRPFVDEFMLRASKHYEIVIFTASLSKYADPLLDKLDIHNTIDHRLFRESCVIHGTAYVKDLRKLGRKLKDSIIVDNSPPSYLFQPTNAVPCTSWFDDKTDTQLLDFCPVIETTLNQIDDVRKILDANNKSFRWLCNQAHQPLTKFTVRNDLVNRQQ